MTRTTSLLLVPAGLMARTSALSPATFSRRIATLPPVSRSLMTAIRPIGPPTTGTATRSFRDQAAGQRDVRAVIRDALELDQSEKARAARKPAADDRADSAEDRSASGRDRHTAARDRERRQRDARRGDRQTDSRPRQSPDRVVGRWTIRRSGRKPRDRIAGELDRHDDAADRQQDSETLRCSVRAATCASSRPRATLVAAPGATRSFALPGSSLVARSGVQSGAGGRSLQRGHGGDLHPAALCDCDFRSAGIERSRSPLRRPGPMGVRDLRAAPLASRRAGRARPEALASVGSAARDGSRASASRPPVLARRPARRRRAPTRACGPRTQPTAAAAAA